MDVKDIAARLGYIAEDLLPLVAGPKGAAAVEIAKGLIDLGHKAAEVLDQDDAAPLAAKLQALEARVTAYAEKTSAALRGN